MPSSVFVHATVFTAGALLGGGIAAAVSSRQKFTQTAPSVKPPPSFDTTGNAKVSTEISAYYSLPSPLKYGHPGALSPTYANS